MTKLVRDRIIDILRSSGENPQYHVADDKEFWERLKKKLQEEVIEFINDEKIEELADILEVLYAIYDFKKFDRSEIESIRQKKAAERGGLSRRIILD